MTLGLAVSLVIAEGVLRLFHLAPAQGIATVTQAQFETIPGIFAPNQDYVDSRIPGYRSRVTTGALGYRGDTFPLEKPAGEYRVLMIGDSFTFGDFVADHETLPSRIAQALSRRCTGVRIINAGLGGTSLVAHHAMAERGLAISPDLVLLTFSENDVVDLGGPSQWEQLAANRATKSRFPLSVIYPAVRRTALWNLALLMRSRWRARWRRSVAANLSGFVPIHMPLRVADSTSLAQLRAEYVQRLQALSSMLSAQGVQLHAAAFPSHKTLTGQSAEQIDWFLGVARRLRVPAVNLLPTLRQSALGEALYLLPHDGHPSPKGYEIAGRVLAGYLASGPLAGRCTSTGGPDTTATSSARSTGRGALQLGGAR